MNRAQEERPAAGALANCASFAAVSIGDALAKLAVAAVPIAQAMAMRSLFLLVMLAPVFVVAARRGVPLLATRKPHLHVIRVVIQTASVAAFLYGLRSLPLTTVTTIMFMTPAFIALAAGPILGERLRPHQAIAIALGFIGCFVILQPRADGDAWLLLICLFSSATWAISSTLLRLLTRTESQPAILIWGNGLFMLAAGAFSLLDWRPMDERAFLLILGMAAMQVVSQWLSMTAFRIARAATVAPAQYTQILWATLLGAAVFGEWPQPRVGVGAVLIIAGAYWLLRDRTAP